MSKKNVLVAMSGGVDSSVAAFLLKEQGYSVTGVFMDTRNAGKGGTCSNSLQHGCCRPDGEDLADAQKVAHLLKINIHILDVRREYESAVLQYFRDEYLTGRTPNPCIACNSVLKFGLLPERISSLTGIRFPFFATGHYAITGYNARKRRYTLKKARDSGKDQSYFLCMLTQQQLAGVVFPLGEYTKEQVRSFARGVGLPVLEKPESQDFIDGAREALLSQDVRPGDIVDSSGRYLGRHRGIANYTIGQRKGLGIAGGTPLYVTGIDAYQNRLVVGQRKHVYSKSLVVSHLNMVSLAGIDEPLRVYAKIRYRHKSARATVYPPDSMGLCRVEFESAQWAATPGQAAVFYKSNMVIGAGFIENAYSA